MSDIYQVNLEPLWKFRYFCVDINYGQIFINFPPMCLHFSHSVQPKDTPLKLLVFTQIPTLLHGLKRHSTKVPIQNAYLSLYMPLSLQLRLFSFHHQSSTIDINLLQDQFLTKTYCLPQCSHWCNENQIKQLLFSTSQTYHLPKTNDEKKKTYLHCFRIPLLIRLPPSYSPNLHSMPQLPQPSIAWC